MTEIDAINRMLRYIGELPIPSDVVLDDLPEGHEALQARIILQETVREEQESRYWFNKQVVSYYPNSSGYITLPDNVISLQPTDNRNLVKSGNDLYDVEEETKIFDEAVELDVLLEIPFDDLPDVFRTYVVLIAAKHLHTYLNGDETTQQELMTKIQLQTVKVQKEHMKQSKYNLIKGTRLIDRGGNPSALA